MNSAGSVRATFLLVAASLVAVSAAAQEVGYKDLTEVAANPLRTRSRKRTDASEGLSRSVLLNGLPFQTQIGGYLNEEKRVSEVRFGFSPSWNNCYADIVGQRCASGSGV
jgi:hypothetical protein